MTFTIILLSMTLALVACSQPEREHTSDISSRAVTNTTIDDIVSSTSEITQLASGMHFLEGPIWDATHNRLIFSEVMTNKLHQWTTEDGVSVFLEPSGYAGGNAFDRDGAIISCQGGARQIARITTDMRVESLVYEYRGKKFNSPNDVVIKSDGTIWFTDPDYGLLAAYGEKAGDYRELDKYHIFRFDPDTKEIVSVHSELSKPNGLTFSRDETQLFVGNSEVGERRLVVFDVTPSNDLTNKRTLAAIESQTWGIDGLKMDEHGNLYAACGDGVNIFTSEGTLIGKIATAFEVTNLCFGGANGSTLFLTGHEGLYATELKVAGK